MTRTTGLATIAVIAFLTTTTVLAGPEEDYQRGREAFHRDDLIGAMQWLGKASDAGHAAAQALLAYILDRAEEDAEALRLFRAAADKGNPDAMFGLAGMYAAGEGVARDEARALRWYRQAAIHGHEHATLVLADAHLQGHLGLPRDQSRGIELLKQGASSGYVPAQQRLQQIETARK